MYQAAQVCGNWKGEPAHFARNPTIIRGGRIWRNFDAQGPARQSDARGSHSDRG